MKTNRSVRAFLALSSALLLTVSVAYRTPVAEAPGTTAARSDIPKIDFEKYTLPNGLDVILSRGPPAADGRGQSLVSRRARQRRAGPHRVRAPVRAHDVPGLEARAAATRTSSCSKAPARSDINGTTDFDRTNYFETLPVEPARAGAVARVRSHGLSARHARPGAALPTSRTSCATSGGRASRTSPYGIVEEAMFHHAVPEGPSVLRGRHRLARRHPGGEARRREELLQDRTTRPTTPASPSSATSTRRATKALVEKYFGPLQAGRRRCRSRHGDDADDHRRAARGRARTASSCRASTWRGSRRRSSSRATPTRTSRRTILGGGKSSRLYKKLVYDKQIAQNVSAQQYSLMLGSVFQHRGDRAARAHRRGAREGDRRRARASSATPGPTPAEVERARNIIETRIVQGLENARRLRRRRRSPQHLQPLPRRPRLSAEGHPALSRGHAGTRARRSRSEQLKPNRARRRSRRARPAGSRRAGADAAGSAGASRRRAPNRSTPTRRGARSRRRPARSEPLQLPTPDVVHSCRTA